MNGKLSLRSFVVATAVFGSALGTVAFAADFQAAVDWIYYQDAAGRQIDYGFSPGTIDADGFVDVPGSAVTLPGSEAGATFSWGPGEGLTDVSLSSGLYYLSIPQARSSIVSIPTANITVDGAAGDWSGVGVYAQDSTGDVLQPGAPTGCDVEYVKLAYKSDYTKLYILYKLTSNANTNVWYRLFLDTDLDEHVDEPGDWQIDVSHWPSGWEVVSQGWTSEDVWYPVEENGVAVVSGQYVEASVDCSAFGLPTKMDCFGRTMQSDSPYLTYDWFHTAFGGIDGSAYLAHSGLVAAAPTTWEYGARIRSFTDPGYDDAIPYLRFYGAEVRAASTDSSNLQPSMGAFWATGDFMGDDADDALVITAMVEAWSDSDEYEWQWDPFSGGGVVLNGLDPSTAVVDLKIGVTNAGQTATFYYRINSDGAWQQAVSHTLPGGVGTLYGMPTTSPTVDLETGFERSAPMYRFWNASRARHFYTISRTERNKLINSYSHIWAYEGTVYYTFAEDSNPGVLPVYRFWSDKSGAHFYTISETEKNKLVNTYSHVWTYEGPAFYAYPDGQEPAGTSPVYRFWSTKLGTHFYTMSESEKNKLMTTYSHVWSYEGVAWHAFAP